MVSNTCIQLKKIAWLLDMQCSHWCRDAWEDVPSCPLFVHLAYQWLCSFLFVCFVGLYAGHPYIHLISFEIFLLAFINSTEEVVSREKVNVNPLFPSPTSPILLCTHVSLNSHELSDQILFSLEHVLTQ